MNRLTERGDDGEYFARVSKAGDLVITQEERIGLGQEKWTCWWEYAVLGQIVDRLAAYEDTGLEPEEIIELKARMEGLEK